MNVHLDLIAQDGAARRGRLHTAHGTVETPAFMPVGTAATVKGMMIDDVQQSGAQMVLANTYHMMVRPGEKLVAEMGGLHRFMGWPGPILTDSGGYQVMSLKAINKMSEEGVVFRSHLDGSYQMLSPERSIAIQHDLDATITMAFDECTPFPASHDDARQSMLRSMRWARRSQQHFQPRPGYAIFGICQGSVFADLRHQSVEMLCDIGFDGYAIGGLAVGESKAEMLAMIEATNIHMPPGKPRYLMGVGKPDDLVQAVALGVDLFDCVLPTRCGRNGQAFTSDGTRNLRNAGYRNQDVPLDASCACPCCQRYSRGYLHHLVRAKEMLGAMLLSQHNIYWYQALMGRMRKAIEEGVFSQFIRDFTHSRIGADDAIV